jgi:hypothetical protein
VGSVGSAIKIGSCVELGEVAEEGCGRHGEGGFEKNDLLLSPELKNELCGPVRSRPGHARLTDGRQTCPAQCCSTFFFYLLTNLHLSFIMPPQHTMPSTK